MIAKSEAMKVVMIESQYLNISNATVSRDFHPQQTIQDLS